MGRMRGRTRTLCVAAVSPEIHLGDVAGNLSRIREGIRAASVRGAKLIVLPELGTSGYVFRDRAEAAEASVSRDDAGWADLASALPAESVAVVGYAERDGPSLFNTAAVFTRDERLGDYRKAHLWGAEGSLFEAGNQAGAVFETPIGRLGVAICYDNEFPEVPRRIALAGAELLALPVNWPLLPRPDGEHPPETIQAMAAARSSRLPTVIADRRATPERGVDWTAGSAVVDDTGWITALPDANGIALSTLTLSAPGDKSLPPHNDLFGDRRPDLY